MKKILFPVAIALLACSTTVFAQDQALDKNNLSHIETWYSLRMLDQSEKVFKDSGKIKIAGFPIWQETGLMAPSAILARLLDKTFVQLSGARRETPEAPALLARILETGRRQDQNMRWLADRIDELYLFYKEKP